MLSVSDNSPAALKKTVPVVLSQKQIADELHVPFSRVYRAVADGQIVPDFIDRNGQSLVRLTRLPEIRRVLTPTPAIV